MQSKTSRVALVVAAAVIAVAAFLVLRPGDDDEEQAATADQAGQAAPAADGGGGKAGSGDQRQKPAPEQEPEVPEIEIRNGSVVGGPEEIEVEQGERIEFEVTSDTPDEIHVHGYELTEQVAPGGPARFSFQAENEGIYEVEAHDIGHVVIAELRVTPS